VAILELPVGFLVTSSYLLERFARRRRGAAMRQEGRARARRPPGARTRTDPQAPERRQAG
jgi:hypothetical protein